MKTPTPPVKIGETTITLTGITKTLKSVKYLPELSGVAKMLMAAEVPATMAAIVGELFIRRAKELGMADAELESPFLVDNDQDEPNPAYDLIEQLKEQVRTAEQAGILVDASFVESVVDGLNKLNADGRHAPATAKVGDPGGFDVVGDPPMTPPHKGNGADAARVAA